MTKIIPFVHKKEKVWIRISHNLVLHKHSGIYYVRKKKAGKQPLFRTTAINTKGKAQTRADEIVAEWMGGKRQHRGKVVSCVCDELLISLRNDFAHGDRRKRTFDQDKTYLPLIKRYFGDSYIDEIDEESWNRWVRTVGKSLNRNLCDIAKYLSKTLSFSLSRGYISRKPEIENPDKKKKCGIIYENEQIEMFILHSEPMLRDLIIVGAECALRPHESRGLRWDWIKFESDRVIIRIPDDYAKTRSTRSLDASPNASECLRRRYLNHTSPFVFPAPKSSLKPISDVQLSRMWRRMLNAGGFPKGIKFHWLRHSFFSKALLDKKLPLAMVSAYGGNSPATLIRRYLQDDPLRTQEVSKVVALNLGCEKGVNFIKKKA